MVAKYRIGRPKRPFKFGGPVLVHRLHMHKSGPASCVRCGGRHLSANFQNTRDAPPKCTFCSDDHPLNYKECSIYNRGGQTIDRGRFQSRSC
jgi:hypothetical protein